MKGDHEKHPYIFPEVEYLIYLRHHGFPAPIIDWTASQYIALFFACEDFANSKTDGKVFFYKHTITNQNPGEPWLEIIFPSVETDRRHFSQQCWYLLPQIYEYERGNSSLHSKGVYYMR